MHWTWSPLKDLGLLVWWLIRKVCFLVKWQHFFKRPCKVLLYKRTADLTLEISDGSSLAHHYNSGLLLILYLSNKRQVGVMHVCRAPFHEPHSSCVSLMNMWLIRGLLFYFFFMAKCFFFLEIFTRQIGLPILENGVNLQITRNFCF